MSHSVTQFKKSLAVVMMVGSAALAGTSAHAAVVVEDSANNFTDTNADFALGLTIDSTTNNVLIVVLAANDNNSNTITATYQAGQTDEISLTKLEEQTSPNAGTIIFAAEVASFASTGAKSISVDTGTGTLVNAQAYYLSNATLTGGGTFGAGGNANEIITLDVHGVSAGDFITGVSGNKNTNLTTYTDVGPSDAAVTDLTTNARRPLFIELQNAAAGDYDLTWDGNNKNHAAAAIWVTSAAEVPEPASLALMGLGTLLMLGRTRRASA